MVFRLKNTIHPCTTTYSKQFAVISKVDENSDVVRNVMTFAVEELNRRHNNPKRAMVSEIVSVHSQVSTS